MLFRKRIARSCNYCSYGTKFDNEQVLCIKRGVVSADTSCRKFAYDPCKRVPPKFKAMNFSEYKEEDFTL